MYAILIEAAEAPRGCLEPVKCVFMTRRAAARSFILQGLQLAAGSGHVNVLPGVIMSP